MASPSIRQADRQTRRLASTAPGEEPLTFEDVDFLVLFDVFELFVLGLAVLRQAHRERSTSISAGRVVLNPQPVLPFRWVLPEDVLNRTARKVLVRCVHVDVEVAAALALLVVPEDVRASGASAVQVKILPKGATSNHESLSKATLPAERRLLKEKWQATHVRVVPNQRARDGADHCASLLQTLTDLTVVSGLDGLLGRGCRRDRLAVLDDWLDGRHLRASGHARCVHRSWSVSGTGGLRRRGLCDFLRVAGRCGERH